jgi:hypothetical protein
MKPRADANQLVYDPSIVCTSDWVRSSLILVRMQVLVWVSHTPLAWHTARRSPSKPISHPGRDSSPTPPTPYSMSLQMTATHDKQTQGEWMAFLWAAFILRFPSTSGLSKRFTIMLNFHPLNHTQQPARREQ